jgi:hypothetical protein
MTIITTRMNCPLVMTQTGHVAAPCLLGSILQLQCFHADVIDAFCCPSGCVLRAFIAVEMTLHGLLSQLRDSKFSAENSSQSGPGLVATTVL